MTEEKHGSLTTVSGSCDNLVEVSTHQRLLRRKNKEKWLLSIPPLILLCFIFFVAFVAVQVKYSKILADKICSSKDCIQSASELLQMIDQSKDPCTDFYAFVCGNFAAEHPIPDNRWYHSWFEEGETKLGRMVKQVLENRTRTKVHSLEITKNFYRSCIDIETLESKGLQPLYDLLETLKLPKFPTPEAAESFNLGLTLGLLQRYLNKDVIVQVGFTHGPLRPSDEEYHSYILQIIPILKEENIPSVRSDPFNIDLASFANPQKVFMQRLTLMTRVMGVIYKDLEESSYPFDKGHNDTTLLVEAVKIMTFATQLLEVITEEAESNDTTKGTLMTFEQLQIKMDEYTPSTTEGNRISWEDYLKALFSDLKGYNKYEYNLDNVDVLGIELFKSLAVCLSTKKPVTIQRFLWWVVVSDYAIYTTQVMKSAYDEYQEKLYGSRSTASRSSMCVSFTRKLLPNRLASAVKSTFSWAEDTKKVSEMLRDIKEEFVSMVHDLDWMDYKTKKFTVQKAQAVQEFIGYEDVYLNNELIEKTYSDLHLTSTELIPNLVRLQEKQLKSLLVYLKKTHGKAKQEFPAVTNPLQVNAFYYRGNNAIYIPAGILQRPFYYRGLQSLNYGAIGSILGHELTHGFDIDGKDFDQHGHYKKNLWPPKVTQIYEDKAQCFVKQYNMFNVSKSARLNGTYTLAENIADNGGLRETYYAYQSFVRRHGSEPKLLGLEDYSHEQLLFIAFASIWCEATAGDTKSVHSSVDSHSPNRVRVQATLQNMKEFSSAFKCRKKSFMNPEKKCVLW